MDTATSKSLGMDTATSKSPGVENLVPVTLDFTPKSKKRGKPPWKNPRFCTSVGNISKC